MAVFYALGADFIVVIHFLYVLFAVGAQVCVLLGGAFKWHWVRNSVFRMIHLAAVGLVAAEAAIGVLCPLTVWEYNLRFLAGQAVEKKLSFIARIVRLVIFHNFPPWVFTVAHISFGLLVIATFILIPPHFRQRSGRPSDS